MRVARDHLHGHVALEPLVVRQPHDAEAAGLEVTQAEIECDLGCLALFQGRYDRALGYLAELFRFPDWLTADERERLDHEVADHVLLLHVA